MQRVQSAEILDLLDGDPQRALSVALDTAASFAQDQRQKCVEHDVTLSGTFFYRDGDEHFDRDGTEPYLPTLVPSEPRGWVLSSAEGTVNRFDYQSGLVLLRSGEVSTYFRGRYNPVLGNIATMGNRLYRSEAGAAIIEEPGVVEDWKRWLPPPEPKAATKLAGKILLGIFQRQNFQERKLAQASAS